MGVGLLEERKKALLELRLFSMAKTGQKTHKKGNKSYKAFGIICTSNMKMMVLSQQKMRKLRSSESSAKEIRVVWITSGSLAASLLCLLFGVGFSWHLHSINESLSDTCIIKSDPQGKAFHTFTKHKTNKTTPQTKMVV